ncbi:putative transcription factor C2H2 family [Helianthus annuus]|uniref:Putative zinc finger, RING/FYVE/PHD-type n=1 Tax=Helianthus annuus TaxID=4232 RepID=A0A251RX62_HELAN|nr:RING-H2 finger protein ATL56 [Helianthus annuus]KAF5758568.1 putative transcription factor C2H2 family [Helianthus annuus]KAJ0436888.1 putative transcription factor C2H2 family [Helianthus annuus]KAJ0459200.1 putative transcription factor C2H2 family [Helianthus annuus]KAJ0639756.1 putative transcription factor C2H2 family [Helianthus annuus]
MVIEIVTSGVILVAGIAIFVVIHVCIVGRTFGSMNGGGSLVDRNGGTTMVMISRSGSMSEEDIKKLPSYDFNMEAAEKAMVKCVVCLERFKSGEKCKLLPNCNHSFHGECIDSWLIKTGACPICRAIVDLGSGQTSFSNEVELELR